MRTEIYIQITSEPFPVEKAVLRAAWNALSGARNALAATIGPATEQDFIRAKILRPGAF
jgi:hypothetical protein